MTVEFRCNRCGATVRADADPGQITRCGQCGRRLVVPAALAKLPSPHVPGIPPTDVPPPAAASAHDVAPDGYSEATHKLALAMPWVLSVFFHAGLGIIAMFLVMIATAKSKTEASAPDAFDPHAPLRVVKITQVPIPIPMPTAGIGLHRAMADRRDPPRMPTEPAGGQNAGSKEVRDPLIGWARQRTGHKPKGIPGRGPGRGGGSFDPVPGDPGGRLQGPRHIVYVVDRSGSMSDSFDGVVHEMLVSISRLQAKQTFHVILFHRGTPLEMPARQLVTAIPRNKIAAVDFLEGVRPQNQTDPVPALKRAFAVLRHARGKGGKLVYLLTDGNFPDNQAVLDEVRKSNADKEVKICTILHGPPNANAEKVLRAIAELSGGIFRHTQPVN